MTIKEMVGKTGIRVIGIVKGVEEYVSKKNGNSYFSVLLDVKDSKIPLKINLPVGFPLDKFKEWELAQIDCTIRPTWDRKNTELVALSN